MKSFEKKVKHNSLMVNQNYEKILNRYLDIWDKNFLVKIFMFYIVSLLSFLSSVKKNLPHFIVVLI